MLTHQMVDAMKWIEFFGHVGNIDDLAQTVCYLASLEAGFITGQVLNVNGGLKIG